MAIPSKTYSRLRGSALKLHGFATAICMAVMLPSSAYAAPQMPMGFKPTFSNDTGRTWRQMGILPQPFAMARAAVKTAMTGQGYKLVHDIAENENATRRLLFWRKEEEDVILMVWQEDLYSTGVSWGISKRGTDAENEEFGVGTSSQTLPPQPNNQVLQGGLSPADKAKDRN